jgi:hypothetical protein
MIGRGHILALSLASLVLGWPMQARSATLSASCDDQRHDVIFFTLSGNISHGDATALAAKIDPATFRMAMRLLSQRRSMSVWRSTI